MKIIALNGSPKKSGNTARAIDHVFEQLNLEGIETEVIQIGNRALKGCLSCGWCGKNPTEKCVIKDDEINDVIQKMKNADGFILASPVHWSAMGGALKSALDRIFYVSGANGNLFRHKVGASVVAVRRSGGIPTFEQLNNYLLYSEMMIPTSNYWNVAHGTIPGDLDGDDEGKQIMRVLGKNMAYLLKVMEHSKNAITPPEVEEKIFTNFIR